MDEKLDRVFDRLMALTPAQFATKLATYRNDSFARTLDFLNSVGAGEPLISKKNIEINRLKTEPQVKDEDLSDWEFAANDERFALAV